MSILVRNLDAEQVVISADHGNAFGELSVYGHPPSVHIPALRRVPWVEVDAEDEETIEGDRQAKPSMAQVSAADRLRDLGYLEGEAVKPGTEPGRRDESE